jgi:hypothetical protein
MKIYFMMLVLVLTFEGFSSPRYNGVSFISLNGWMSNSGGAGGAGDEKLCWVLDNQNLVTAPGVVPAHNVPDMLQKTFRAYQQAGVNLIRLIIDPTWQGCNQANEYPSLTDLQNGNIQPLIDRITTVNILSQTASQYGIKTSLTFNAVRTNNMYTASFDREWRWLEAWLTRIDRQRIVFVNLGTELAVFSGDAGGPYKFYPIANPIGFEFVVNNHGDYATNIWNRFRDPNNANHLVFQSIPASMEIFSMDQKEISPCGVTYNALGMRYRASPNLIANLANMIGTMLPGAAAASLEYYFTIDPSTPPCNTPPSAPTWRTYRDQVNILLDAYFNSTHYKNTNMPLWIDEFGHTVCNIISNSNCPATIDYQTNYYRGLLEATFIRNNILGQVAWDGSADFPFDENHLEHFGIFSGYDSNNNPIPVPAWDRFGKYPNNIAPILGLLSK